MLASMGKRYPQQDLAERLRHALEEARITQAELARACGVTDQAVYDWLKTGRVGKQHLATICALTGKTLDYLLVGLKTFRRAAALAFLAIAPPALLAEAALRSVGCVLCSIVDRLAQVRPAESP